MEEALLIIGRERSGTTVVRATVATSQAYINLHEAFSPTFLEQGTSSLAQHLTSKDLLAKWMIARNRPQILLEWLDEVRKDSGKIPLIDVKQQFLSICDPFWTSKQRPQLIKFCYARRWAVIHIVRRNKLAALVSLNEAHSRGVWHARSAKAVSDLRRAGPIRLPTEFLRDRIRQLTNDDDAVAGYLKAHPRRVTLEYETMLANGGPQLVQAVRAACDKLGVPAPETDEPPTLRSGNPDLRERIANYDEVAKALRGTPYAWMLDKEKPPSAAKVAGPDDAALRP